MDQSILSSRAIEGAYYERLAFNDGLGWINMVSNMFTSDQAIETYAWLGSSPSMREWVGGRQAKGLRASSFAIANKHYEATLEIAKRDVMRDKTGQILARTRDFADRARSHWASLLSTLILNGESSICYDGQYYFDTDHSEGESGSQSNDLSIDISALPTQVHGVVTAPSVEEMQQCILQAISAILSFKDDRGEPMNESAQQFLVKVPVNLFLTATAAVRNTVLTSNAINLIPNMPEFQISVQMNPRLTWTDKFAVFRTDSPIKGFIRQSEAEQELKVKAEGTEFEFDNDAWQFGIDSWRNVGYGYWQRGCLVTMT